MTNKFTFRDSQINLLISLLWDHRREGTYYGNREKHYALVDETLKQLGYKAPVKPEPRP